ncbi:MAG TPA: hypothetical protein VE617_08250 [Propionibacteriaceae bacterium]|nr:hypothetical protein [Propionibacteriaceae bacterium]
MIVLALVLLTIVLLFSVAIVLSNPDVYQLSLFRVLVPVTSAGVFFTGFGAALVTITALLLLRIGIRRSRETRRRLRAAEHSVAGTAASTPGRSDAGRSEDPDTGAGDPGADGAGDPGGTGRVSELESGRDDDPGSPTSADRPTTSTRELEPGADPTTVPADQRPVGTGADDRDEPRI